MSVIDVCVCAAAVDGKLDIYLCIINLKVIFQACMTSNGIAKSSVLCVFVFVQVSEQNYNTAELVICEIFLYLLRAVFASNCTHRFLSDLNERLS